MSTIPASAIVSVQPGVLSAGSFGLNLIGLVLTNNTRVPIGTVLSLSTAAAVANYFGASSQEAALAATYFEGEQNATLTPAALLFAQYPSSAVGAYLRGGNLSSVSLATLQTYSGVLGLTINGTLQTASISLSGAASFSNAAEIIGNTLGIEGPQVATFTGSIGGTGGASTLLTITSISGTVGIGSVIAGTGVTLGTYITALVSGTGGNGTYNVSSSQFALSAAMTANAPAVTFDSVSNAFIIVSPTTGSGATITYGSGALASNLFLTQSTGAVLSQGTGTATPGPFMTTLTGITQNWATFTTAFNPDASGNANKLLFATWTGQQNNRYAYFCWDNDVSPTTTLPATASLGYLIAQASISGVCLIYDPNNEGVAVAAMGAIAQLNFNQTNGRTNLAFDVFPGLTATVTAQQVASNLLANGYNFYGAYATANQGFVFFYNGQISGEFLWVDSYVNQIWMNNQFQLALMNLLTTIPSIPYNAAGNSIIEQSLASPIGQAVNYGAIRAGVALSSTEIATINNQTGTTAAANAVGTQGWYLKVGTASPAVRVARASPPCTFFYADGQSVQMLNLASIEVQ
jgi:hypothetical protein